MTRYRKLPVEIDAWQFNRSLHGLPHWIAGARVSGKVIYHKEIDGSAYLIIDTLEGKMRADQGDWIIRGVKGEIYPCKPDIFAMTYEKVAA